MNVNLCEHSFFPELAAEETLFK